MDSKAFLVICSLKCSSISWNWPTFLVLFNYGNQIQSNWTKVKTIHGLKLIERALIFTIIWPDIEAFFICSLVLSAKVLGTGGHITRLFGEHITSRLVRTQNRELSFWCIAYNTHKLTNLTIIIDDLQIQNSGKEKI